MNLQYITDEKGEPKAVIIPIKQWEKMKEDQEKLKNKLHVLSGIKEGLREVQDIKEGKRNTGRTLGEFLNEM